MKYQGWTNEETYRAALFIDNNEAAYLKTLSLLNNISKPNYAPDFLKAEWRHKFSGQVNWSELANHFLNKTGQV